MVFTCGRRTFIPHQLAFKLMRRVRFKQQLDINRSVWDVARYSCTKLPNVQFFMHWSVPLCIFLLLISNKFWMVGGRVGVRWGGARGPSLRGRIRGVEGENKRGGTGWLSSLIPLSGPSWVIKFLYSPAPPPPTVCALDLPRINPNALAYRLDAISQGPKNLRIPGPNPLPLPLAMDMHASKTLCTGLYKSYVHS